MPSGRLNAWPTLRRRVLAGWLVGWAGSPSRCCDAATRRHRRPLAHPSAVVVRPLRSINLSAPSRPPSPCLAASPPIDPPRVRPRLCSHPRRHPDLDPPPPRATPSCSRCSGCSCRLRLATHAIEQSTARARRHFFYHGRCALASPVALSSRPSVRRQCACRVPDPAQTDFLNRHLLRRTALRHRAECNPASAGPAQPIVAHVAHAITSPPPILPAPSTPPRHRCRRCRRHHGFGSPSLGHGP